jgi:cobalt-precorrin 5A hydrolase
MERGKMQVIAGFGFRGSAGVDSLRDALQRTAQSHKLTALATPADKATAASLRALATDLNLPVITVTTENLGQPNTATHSPRVQRLRNTGSVAEAAALSAVGVGARLISTRQVSHDRKATCAVAEGGT